MVKNILFTYSWFYDDKETEITSIRIYGIGENNENICLRVTDFTPYIYLELPTHIDWTEMKVQLLGNKIDEILGNHKPLKKCMMMKYKLYGANIKEDGSKKKFPYLFCSFSSKNDIKILMYTIMKKNIFVSGIMGSIKLKMHEQDADPILQLTVAKDLLSSGWIRFSGNEVSNDDKITLCDLEYTVKWKNMIKYEKNTVGLPKIMGFDIEVNSSNPNVMPKVEKPEDKIFQISCVFAREGDTNENNYVSYLLTLGDPIQDIVGEHVNILKYINEAELLCGFTDLIRKENPNVIVGYNILNFDIPYMIDRSKRPGRVNHLFDKLGFHKYDHAKEKIIKWSSSAYKNQEFKFLDAEGRLFVDLLPLVKRDFKMDNYKLKTVSEYFLEQTKDDLSVKGIFKCYRLGIKKEPDGTYAMKARKAMGVVGKYCMIDSLLVVKLMEKLQTFIGLTEMASVCYVQPFTLFTQGQQIKVYSQVYKYCYDNNIVVEKDGYVCKDNERYTGAHVFPPVPGIYERVVPLDFFSLYPTTIIAYNIDYSTLVDDDSIPDSKCHVMNWEDHQNCIHDPKIIRKNELTLYIDDQKKIIKKLREKRDDKKNKLSKEKIIDELNKKLEELKPYIEERSKVVKTISKNVMCAKRHYRFLKEPRGVIPTIAFNLLNARAKTRGEIKTNKNKIKNSKDPKEIQDLTMLNNILDKRQLSYKVSCNSQYGSMGVKRGYLPFMPGAMTCTYMGRTNIEIVAKTIVEKYKGELVYGDSVTGDTPILCRINNKIVYRTIDDLPHSGWIEYKDEKENANPVNIEVWTENGFTKVKNIIRHKTTKELFRVLTHTGVVDVTEDHGLLDEYAEKISPKDINIGSKLLTHDLPLNNDYSFTGINEDLAFVMGLFYADGSCGCYQRKDNRGKISTWAINNQDRELLKKCENILNNTEYFTLSYKILETMESSNVLKLVAVGKNVSSIVETWREMFYDKEKYKKVPDEILWSAEQVRQSFLNGYYAGDGDKDKNGYYRFDNKGKIGASGLYFLASSLGYKVSINIRNDKPNIYRLTCTKKEQRKKENVVKKIVSLGKTEQYVYDLETENHHFSAGVGKLIVHNTDSNYVHFPHLKTAKETWDYAELVAGEISAMFPPPMKLEFEQTIYWLYGILSKKRYVYRECLEDGVVSDKIGKKGVLLSRRDTSLFVRRIYEEIISKIFDNVDCYDVLYYIIEQFNLLCSNSLPYKEFVITKSVGDTHDMQRIPNTDEQGKIIPGKLRIGSYIVTELPKDKKERASQMLKKHAETEDEYYGKCLPAQVQLAEKMKQRGQPVQVGTRLEYLISDINNHQGKQYDKVEHIDYFIAHSNVLTIDFFYYIKICINSVDELLNVAYNKDKKYKKDFIQDQYNFRYKIRRKAIDEIKALNTPKLQFK